MAAVCGPDLFLLHVSHDRGKHLLHTHLSRVEGCMSGADIYFILTCLELEAVCQGQLSCQIRTVSNLESEGQD